MDLFDLVAKITLDTSGYERQLTEIEGRTSGFGEKLKSGLSVAGKVAVSSVAAATTASIAFAGSAVKVGENFDAAMSQVSAISGATGADFDALRDKAQEMGATTKFSASESAEALNYMAMAGWKTEDMLGGIEGIMNLAAASGENLATTSDIVTDALTAFGLSAKDSSRFADVLAAASSNANTNVSMLGESFKYVAPVAGAMGYSAEDASVALGLMANSGIKASQAGTALRTLLSNMANPGKSAAAAMQNLGISLTDDQGEMLSLMDIMQDLRKSFANLGDAEAAEQASLLAGKEGMSGLLAIVNSSEADFEKLTDAIYNADGAASKMAATMQDNLAGDITIAKSAFEGLQIAISDKLTPTLRNFVQFGSSALSQLTIAFQNNGMEGAMDAFGQILANGLSMILDSLPKFIDAGFKLLSALSKGIIDNLPKIIESGINLVITLATAIVSAIPQLIQAMPQIISAIVQGIVNGWPQIKEAGVSLIKTLGEGVRSMIDSALGWGREVIQNFINGILSGWNKLKGALGAFGEKVSGFLGLSPGSVVVEERLVSENNGGRTTVNFTQNNYSPKSLSRTEIYRDTQNGFAILGGAT